MKMILNRVFLSVCVKDSDNVMMDTSGDNHDPLCEEDPLGAVRKRKLSNRAEDCGAVTVDISNILFHF